MVCHIPEYGNAGSVWTSGLAGVQQKGDQEAPWLSSSLELTAVDTNPGRGTNLLGLSHSFLSCESVWVESFFPAAAAAAAAAVLPEALPWERSVGRVVVVMTTVMWQWLPPGRGPGRARSESRRSWCGRCRPCRGGGRGGPSLASSGLVLVGGNCSS